MRARLPALKVAPPNWSAMICPPDGRYDKEAQLEHDPSVAVPIPFRTNMIKRGKCRSRPWRVHLYAFPTQRIRLNWNWTAHREGHRDVRHLWHPRKLLKQHLLRRAARHGRSLFQHPILNSSYECPTRLWELDADCRPRPRPAACNRHSSSVRVLDDLGQ